MDTATNADHAANSPDPAPLSPASAPSPDASDTPDAPDTPEASAPASLRDILTAVREGRLDPSAAAHRLDDVGATAQPGGPSETPESVSEEPRSASMWADATDRIGVEPGKGEAHHPPPGPPPPPPPPPPNRRPHPAGRAEPRAEITDDRETTEVRVRSTMRRVRVIGDRDVRTISVEGSHDLRREGTTLLLDSNLQLPFGEPFELSPMGLDRFRLHLAGRRRGITEDLTIRVNPDIDLDIELTAGALTASRLGNARIRVTAGSVRLDDLSGNLDLHLIGGTARVSTAISSGSHRVRCESGSVTVALQAGSDVRVRAEAQLGRVQVNGAAAPPGGETVVGDGTARLDIDVVMGSVVLELP